MDYPHTGPALSSVMCRIVGGRGSPTPDQEYYEISSCKSHIWRTITAPPGFSRTSTLHHQRRWLGRPQGSISELREMERKQDGWDAFKLQSVEVPKRCDKVFFDGLLQVAKVAAYLVTFLLILLAGIVSKLSMILLTSNLLNASVPVTETNCVSPMVNIEKLSVVNGTAAGGGKGKPVLPAAVDYKEKYVAVIWSIGFCVIIPEICTFLSCFRKVMLRQIQGPQLLATWILAFLSETLHIFGILLFLYEVLSSTDIISGVTLTSACFLLPSILTLFTRKKSESFFPAKITIDLLCAAAQFSALFYWTFTVKSSFNWTLPVSLLLMSCRWWENFVTSNSHFVFIRWLSRRRTNIGQAQTSVYLLVSLWKIILIIGWLATWHAIAAPVDVNIFDVKNVFTATSSVEVGGRMVNGTFIERRQKFWYWKPNAVFLLIGLISTGAGFLGNLFGKYACRIQIHFFSFSAPLCLVTPASVAVAVAICEALRTNPCAFSDIALSGLISVRCPQDLFVDMLQNDYAWLWFLWLASQFWIVGHIWWPVPERRKTNHLFSLPDYGTFPLDVSCTLNRLRYTAHSGGKALNFSTLIDQSVPPTPRSKAKIPANCVMSRLSICTFFDQHMTDHDVVENLKSVLRMDAEQCARRNALKFLIDTDPDYFELECNLFFHHAFLTDTLRGERIIERQITHLMTAFDEAASAVHEFPITLRPPTKITTPYGGQVRWLLPGGNRCTVHLKDTNLIRSGERWTEVMALYYVLGHKIMQIPTDVERKEEIAEQSFVLFTSGATRYKPTAVAHLLQTLKQSPHIGATTCRLRPVGTGPLVWYQMFEYSLRYWLDMATEHMLGSLLTIRPGFTMFRASALMDDNVVKKFAVVPEDQKEFLQFRLGSDQWLCSLLLKQGYKVEYCAAVDASLHVAETFSAYIKETQREIPLKMATVADIICNYTSVLACNENITLIYIGYLIMTLVTTALASGTVLLVIITSLVDLLRMNMFFALTANAVPILAFMVICVFGSQKLQLIGIRILSAVYGLVMLAVLISASVQLNHSWLSASPVSIFMVAFVLTTLLPALFHPQELWNIAFAPLYFIAIPTTFLLTIVHSLCTFHLSNGVVKPDDEELLAKQLERWEIIAKEAQKDPTNPLSTKVPSVDVIDELKKFLPDGKKSVSFACGRFCGIVCCPPPDQSLLEGPFGDLIGRELLQLAKKLQLMEGRLRARRMGLQGFRPRVAPPDGLSVPLAIGRSHDWDQISEASVNFSVSTARAPVRSQEEFYDKFGRAVSNDKLTEWLLSLTDPSGHMIIENDQWMDHAELQRAEPDVLDPNEAGFWRELIDSYLTPFFGTNSEPEDAMVERMKKIRSRLALGFLMVNSLFILMVFLLELRRDDLFISITSPFRTNDKKAASIKIEPTGVAFLLFFFVLMLLQFIAMLMHRWGTFSHLLANTKLFCFRNQNQNGFEHLRENAVQIARELQSLKNHLDGGSADLNGGVFDQGGRHGMSTLDVVFRKRLLAIQRSTGQDGSKGLHVAEIHGARSGNDNHLGITDYGNGVSRQPMDRPSVVEVFHIGRRGSMDGSFDGSMKSTTSF